MEITLIYIVSLASAACAVLFWGCYRRVDIRTRVRILLYIRKGLLYTLAYRRRLSSDDVTVFSLLKISSLVAANITACVLKLQDSNELGKRCGSLFLANMIPLFFGGRRGFMNDQILRTQTSEQALVHRWMGRICVTQGIIHGIISIGHHSPSIPHIISMSFLGSLGLLSVLYVRQYIFEIFLKSHVISAVGLIGLLWFHVPLRYHLSTICLGIASGLWIMQEAYWVACLGMQNIGSRSPRICDVVIHADPNGSAEALSLTVCLKGSPKSTSGQFLYLTIPRLSRHRAGFAQAHPYAIAWVDNSVVTMFIQRRSGFSNDLFSVPNIGGSGIIVDGPYGSPQQLHTYDKVLFIASGIGIASHLVAIKELLEAHEDKSAQVRRITLVWFLETSEQAQEQLANRFLHQLLAIDERQIFTLALYIPPRAPADVSGILATERYLRTDQPLNLEWYIDKEASSEAGDMMVSVCGTPHFEDAVRRGVRASKQNVYVSYTSFRPEESRASKASQMRYS